MKQLDSRLEDFSAEARLLQVMLGLLSWGQRVEVLSAVRGVGGKVAADSALVHFFLGVISATRTLRATLGSVRPATEPDSSSRARHGGLSHVFSLR